MERLNFVAIFGLFLIAISICSGEVTLTVDQPVLNIGDTVKLTCYVAQFTGGNVISWSRIYQVEGNERKETVAQNVQKVAPFTTMDRYSVTNEDLGGGAFNMILTIAGVELVDTGIFRCHYDGSNEEARQTVTVLSPPTTIELEVDGNAVDDGASLDMEDGEVHSVMCRVSGSNPIPTMKMSIRKKIDDTMETDITTEFTDNPLITYVAESSAQSLRKPTASRELKNEQLTITGNHGNRFIVCTGSVQNNEPISKAFFVKFKGTPPQFDCYKSLTSYTTEQDVEITCTVNADPEITAYSVTYSVLDPKLNLTETLNKTRPAFGHYRLDYEQEKYEKKGFLILYMRQVFAQMFRNYTFMAKNDYGKSDHTVTLIRDPSAGPVLNSGGSAMSRSSVLSVLIVAICMAFYSL